MDMASPILDFATRLWDCSSSHAAYVTNLGEILSSLRSEIEQLKAMSDDVKLDIRSAEQHGMVPSKQATDWLRRAEAIENEVNAILQQGDASNQQNDAGTSGPRTHQLPHYRAYRLGKKATKKLELVRELRRRRGEFQGVANHQQIPLTSNENIECFCEMPMEKTVGIESTLEVVLEQLKKDAVGIIGLYGMGGVGKTTLLKKINNELIKRDVVAFDVAIWVVASKQARVEAIQQDILDKLRVSSDLWRNKRGHTKASVLYQFLKGKKYILMLDDVWERLDLSEVGLPMPDNQNRCKIILTTRSEEICCFMEAHFKVKVTCLPWEKAWALFMGKAGEATLASHYEISRLAKLVARECDGLPLALITVGRAMSSRKTPYEWAYALQVLKKYPSEFSGMGDHVLPIMKFSYDSLPDPTVKACFVYCSIFPEDYEISRNKLINLWIAEGYLNEYDDISEARNQGFYVLESLKLACLLESGVSQTQFTVKMHDVIRDMALWIAREYGRSNNKFLILERTELVSSVEDWNKKVEKMSLWGDRIHAPILASVCVKLSTLVITGTTLRKIPSDLFLLTPSVRVLDLSGNKSLKSLPEEISTLTYLEYLDLSDTRIQRLPQGLRCLFRLKQLILNYMEELHHCPTDIVSHLRNLQVFRMNFCQNYPAEFLRALQSLKQIKEISIYLTTSDAKECFQSSNKLQNCVRYLRLAGDSLTASIQLSATNLINLEALQMSGMWESVKMKEANLDCVYESVSTEECFRNLHHVVIYQCYSLRDLNWLVHAPSLESLWVSDCISLERVVHLPEEDVKNYSNYLFSTVKSIRLENLSSLHSLCTEPLPFPSLEKVYIQRCPVLCKLPFKHSSVMSSLVVIKGEDWWWNQLQWEHELLKEHFSQYFESWTASMLETVNGPIIDLTSEWPEPESSLLYNRNNNFDENLIIYLLRSSMSMWEE